MTIIKLAAESLSLSLAKHASRKGAELLYRHVVSDSKENLLTYSGLWERSETLAEFLRTKLRPGHRVVLAYPAGLEFIVAIFACLSAGLIAVPLPLPRQDGPGLRRFIHACRDCLPSIVLTTEDQLTSLRSSLPPDISVLLRSDRHLQDLETADTTCPSRSAHSDIAILQYTSGSTGMPKGVMLSTPNLLANLSQIQSAFGHTSDSSGVIWLPHYHDMGLIGGIFQPLYVGFPVTLFSPLMFMQQPLRWLTAIDRYKATTSGGPCFAYDLCVEKAMKKPDLRYDLSSWRVAFSGAETVRLPTLQRFSRVFSKHGFNERAFVSCYGLAEATLLVTSTPCGEGGRIIGSPLQPVRNDSRARQLVSSGVPAPGISIEIRDPSSGVLCKEGDVGEIRVAGSTVSPGIWNSSENAPAPAPESPWLRTGDLGLLRDGELYVTGRIKDVIIIRGQNFFADDIEEIMRTAIPELEGACCAAFGVDGVTGEELILLQEVGTRTLRKLSIESAGTLIKEAVLRSFGVMPSVYMPVRVGSLARTSSGKISRSTTRQLYIEKLLAQIDRAASSRPVHA